MNKSEEYLNILSNYDEKKMKDFLLKNGKDPKPICPIWFFPDDKKEEKICQN